MKRSIIVIVKSSDSKELIQKCRQTIEVLDSKEFIKFSLRIDKI